MKTEEKERARGSTGAIERGRERTYRLAEGQIDGWIFLLFIVLFFSPDVDQLWRNVEKFLQGNDRRKTRSGETYNARVGVFGKYIFNP